jgi:predicted CoA-binding protein
LQRSLRTDTENPLNDKSLVDVEEPIDIVDVFRPSEDVPAVVEQAIKKKPKVIWLEEGIHNQGAEEEATKHGLDVVWNRCMMKEYSRRYKKPAV